MHTKCLLKIISALILTTIFLQAKELNELRALLGDETAIEKEQPIKNENQISIEAKKEESSSVKNTNYNSFLDVPEDYYTINITTTNGISEAKNYLITNNLNILDVYFYSFGPEMKNAKIIYGIFKSVDEAKEAMNKLPDSIIKNKPYIDNIKKHQKLFLKYN